MALTPFFRELQKEKFSGLDEPKIVDAPHCKGGKALHFKPSDWIRLRLFFKKGYIRDAQQDDWIRGAERYHVLQRSKDLFDPVFKNYALPTANEPEKNPGEKAHGTEEKKIIADLERIMIEPFLPWEERTPHGVANIRYRDAGTVSPVQARKHLVFERLKSTKPIDIWRIDSIALNNGVLVDVMPRLIREEKTGKEQLVIAVEPVDPPKV